MALSTVVLVGEAQKWLPDLIDLSRKLKVNAGVIVKRRRMSVVFESECQDTRLVLIWAQ